MINTRNNINVNDALVKARTTGVITALDALQDLASDGTTPPATRAQAAATLLKMAGYLNSMVEADTEVSTLQKASNGELEQALNDAKTQLALNNKSKTVTNKR